MVVFLNSLILAKRHFSDSIWNIATGIIAVIVAAPLLALLIKSFSGFDGALWSHLADTVLFSYLWNSLILVFGVCFVALIFGVGCAWLVVRYEFFGRRWLEWLLLLPLSVPSYIVAYCYTDFFEYGGFVHNLLRDLFGWESPFEVRSLWGAILVMGSVLYPYIYLLSRLAFRLVPRSLYEVCFMHDRSLFFSVGLPICRPAIVGGLALVAMETLADFGTVEFFAVDTLTLGIFNLWFGMNNLVAAAQLSCFSFLFIFILLWVERSCRGDRRFSVSSSSISGGVNFIRHRLFGLRSFLVFLVCIFPLFLGFILPIFILLSFVIGDFSLGDFDLFVIVGNSLLVAFLSSFVIILVSLFLVFVSFYRGGFLVRLFVFVGTGGYAFSGIILAIGVLLLFGFFGNYFNFSVSFIFGGLFLLLFGYVVRFNAVGFSSIYSGVLGLPLHWLSASLILGRGFFRSLFGVGFPLLRGSIFVGFLLCFVDIMKELPIILLLRPFNFDTLATVIYEYAHAELLEFVAVPSLLIILFGLFPIIFVNIFLNR